MISSLGQILLHLPHPIHKSLVTISFDWSSFSNDPPNPLNKSNFSVNPLGMAYVGQTGIQRLHPTHLLGSI